MSNNLFIIVLRVETLKTQIVSEIPFQKTNEKQTVMATVTLSSDFLFSLPDQAWMLRYAVSCRSFLRIRRSGPMVWSCTQRWWSEVRVCMSCGRRAGTRATHPVRWWTWWPESWRWCRPGHESTGCRGETMNGPDGWLQVTVD